MDVAVLRTPEEVREHVGSGFGHPDAEVDGRRVSVRLVDSRITEVGPSLSPAPGEDRYDARGGVLLPGLHDHHVHLHAMAAAATFLLVAPLTALWLWVSWVLPHRGVGWKSLLPGALLVAVGFQVLHVLTMWLAIQTQTGIIDRLVTVEMKTNFLNGARAEDVVCTATVLKLGRRLIYGTAECTSTTGNLLTHHTVTYIRAGG